MAFGTGVNGSDIRMASTLESLFVDKVHQLLFKDELDSRFADAESSRKFAYRQSRRIARRP